MSEVVRNSKVIEFISPIKVTWREARTLAMTADRTGAKIYVRKNRGGYYPMNSFLVFLSMGIKKRDRITLMCDDMETADEILTAMKNHFASFANT